MTPGDTARVLAKAAAYDHRTVGPTDVAAWHEALGDLNLNDCLHAVTRHYREHTDWLQPAHIRHLAASETDRRPYNQTVRQALGTRPQTPPDAHTWATRIRQLLRQGHGDA